MTTHAISKKLFTLVAISAIAVLAIAPQLLFANGGPTVEAEVLSCEPTVITLSDGSLNNEYFVADTEDGDPVFKKFPGDGSETQVSVGPFTQDTTLFWRVFGGGERDYDMPLWNGYGSPSFTADIVAYANDYGGYGWVLEGTDGDNPFTTWNELEVPGCAPEVKRDCFKGGFETYGFKNQGQCVRFVETGKDSR